MDSGDNNRFEINIDLTPKAEPKNSKAKVTAKKDAKPVSKPIVEAKSAGASSVAGGTKPASLKPNMGKPSVKKPVEAPSNPVNDSEIPDLPAEPLVVVQKVKEVKKGKPTEVAAKAAVATSVVSDTAKAKAELVVAKGKVESVVASPDAKSDVATKQAVKPEKGKVESSKVEASKTDKGKPEKDKQAAKGDKQEEEAAAPPPGRKFLMFTAVPAWAVSTLVHTLLILVLALITFADPTKATSILTVAGPAEEEGESDIQQFDLQDIEPPTVETSEEVEPPVDTPPPMAAVTPVPVQTPLETAAVTAETLDFSMQDFSSDSLSKSLSQSTSQSKSLNSRSKDMKKELLKRYGGSDASEAAVSRALKWISLHQTPTGGWTFEHHLVCGRQCDQPGERTKAYNAATSFALLPFFGAGQTHMQGEYKEVVKKGLMFLVNNMKVENRGGLVCGSLMEGEGNMYSHGLAAITLCEAYAMSQDPALAQPAQAALNHIIYAQDPVKGGWRYSPRNDSDTSVVGWQLMALKSGYMGHLQIPPTTFRGAANFLDYASTSKGAYYGYDGPSTGKRPVTTAVGLLCRMYMGWDRSNPGLIEGVQYLAKTGVNKKNMYYNYYAAQVLRQFGGPDWDKFNVEIRDWLVDTQVSKGHATGSWFFPDAQAHSGPHEGGRLAATSFSTMILEVYYRHMPLYADAAAGDDFPL